jgi:voltage-gated potassium channel
MINERQKTKANLTSMSVQSAGGQHLRVPLDGVVNQGVWSLDRSILTGETEFRTVNPKSLNVSTRDFWLRNKRGRKICEVHEMDNAPNDDVRAQIQPHDAIAEISKVLWHLRGILAILLILFLILSVAMYYVGGAVDATTRTQSSFGQTFYFCAVTALTIGYGDVVPTTVLGRIVAVLLGLLGVLATGVATGSAVYGIQMAAQRAGLLPR